MEDEFRKEQCKFNRFLREKLTSLACMEFEKMNGKTISEYPLHEVFHRISKELRLSCYMCQRKAKLKNGSIKLELPEFEKQLYQVKAHLLAQVTLLQHEGLKTHQQTDCRNNPLISQLVEKQLQQQRQLMKRVDRAIKRVDRNIKRITDSQYPPCLQMHQQVNPTNRPRLKSLLQQLQQQQLAHAQALKIQQQANPTNNPRLRSLLQQLQRQVHYLRLQHQQKQLDQATAQQYLAADTGLPLVLLFLLFLLLELLYRHFFPQMGNFHEEQTVVMDL